MPLILVSHPTSSAALYGALAAVVALIEDGLLMHLPAQFTPAQGAGAEQMVAASGALVPSGLLWYERLTGRHVLPASDPTAIVEAARNACVVVPWHAPLQGADLQRDLLAQAALAGLAVTHLHGRHADGIGWLEDSLGEITAHGHWHQDAFGRWASAASPAPQRAPCAPLNIALVATQDDQTNVYPATLAALGDAADAAGVALRIVFVAPTGFEVGQLDSVDGVVLPGGSDMLNVPGQIRAAAHCLGTGKPLLGLCLGMQSMTTALAQSLPGLEQANMAEAAPDAPIKSFVPMAGIAGLAVHRLGDQPLQVSSAKLQHQLKRHPTIRCNHRFMLNPTLRGWLQAAGMSVTPSDTSGQIADAIEWPQHPFYQGMQGHPELCSRAGDPHPMVEAFLRAAHAHTKVSPHSRKP